MLKAFYPDAYMESTYVIPFEKLFEEGYRGIIFDIDNTLLDFNKGANKAMEKVFCD